MRKIQAVLSVLLLALLSSTGISAIAGDFLQNQSSPIKPLKNATLEHSESKSVQRYLLPLGAMIKINGKWRSKKHDILSGELTRTTYLLKDDETFEELRNLDGNLSLNELYQYYFSQLEHHSAKVLFKCKGRNCGSSNQWGNGFVDNKRMVGRDRDQAYLAAKLTGDTAVSFIAIYMVKNVTGETRVHVDSLSKPLDKTTSNVTGSNVGKQSNRILIIPASEIDKLETLALLKKALSQSQDKKTLYFVGHAYGDASMDALKKTSLKYAQQLQQALKDENANLDRKILVEGFGPLAPEGESKDQLDRVELILH